MARLEQGLNAQSTGRNVSTASTFAATDASEEQAMPRTDSYPHDFVARHCAGTSCFHAHPGEAPLPTFPGIEVPHRCDRKGAHGSHDVVDGRCPGYHGHNGLPPEHVAAQAARVRAEVTR